MSNTAGLVAFDPSAREVRVFDQQPLDEALELQNAYAGDEAAFTSLYRRHQAAVYRYLWLLTGSQAQADDITQDVFVELLNTRNRYDPQRGSLAAYLCGIARFKAYRSFDKRMHGVDDVDALVATQEEHDPPALPSDRLERSRALQALYAAIRKLPAPFRDVLILAELQEMSYADVATVAGIELGTVRSRLSRAKAKLAQLLNEGD